MRKPVPAKTKIKFKKPLMQPISDRTKERAKTVLIIVLAISGVLLAVNSGLFQLGASRKQTTASGQASSGSQTGTAGSVAVNIAGPYVIAVTDASGSHCALTYDGAELVQAYDGLSAYLGEALGSAGDPEQITESEWAAALKGTGAYFDFVYAQPIYLLSASLGTSMTSSASQHSARRFCLSLDDGSVYLYYQRARDGEYYKCTTAVNTAAVTAKLGDWKPNGAAFMFETDYDYDKVDGCFLILDGQPQVHAISGQNPLGADFDASALTAKLGMNSYLASSYKEGDGTRVYVDGSCTLRASADGKVTFKNSEPSGADGYEKTDIKAALRTANQIVSATIAASGGIASAVMDGIRYDDSTDTYTVSYDYQVTGLPVSVGPGSAAVITVTGGSVTGAELYYREYTYSGADDSPLPAVQAMAVAQAKGGGMPQLCYVDSGDTVTAGWIIVK
jgi:hypothetical protein